MFKKIRNFPGKLWIAYSKRKLYLSNVYEKKSCPKSKNLTACTLLRCESLEVELCRSWYSVPNTFQLRWEYINYRVGETGAKKSKKHHSYALKGSFKTDLQRLYCSLLFVMLQYGLMVLGRPDKCTKIVEHRQQQQQQKNW